MINRDNVKQNEERGTVLEKLLSTMHPDYVKIMMYDGMMNDEEISNALEPYIQKFIERITINLENETESIEIPENSFLIHVDPREHAKIIIKALICGLDIFRKVEIEEDKKNVKITHFVIDKGGIVYCTELMAQIPKKTDQ